MLPLFGDLVGLIGTRKQDLREFPGLVRAHINWAAVSGHAAGLNRAAICPCPDRFEFARRFCAQDFTQSGQHGLELFPCPAKPGWELGIFNVQAVADFVERVRNPTNLGTGGGQKIPVTVLVNSEQRSDRLGLIHARTLAGDEGKDDAFPGYIVPSANSSSRNTSEPTGRSVGFRPAGSRSGTPLRSFRTTYGNASIWERNCLPSGKRIKSGAPTLTTTGKVYGIPGNRTQPRGTLAETSLGTPRAKVSSILKSSFTICWESYRESRSPSKLPLSASGWRSEHDRSAPGAEARARARSRAAGGFPSPVGEGRGAPLAVCVLAPFFARRPRPQRCALSWPLPSPVQRVRREQWTNRW